MKQTPIGIQQVWKSHNFDFAAPYLTSIMGLCCCFIRSYSSGYWCPSKKSREGIRCLKTNEKATLYWIPVQLGLVHFLQHKLKQIASTKAHHLLSGCFDLRRRFLDSGLGGLRSCTAAYCEDVCIHLDIGARMPREQDPSPGYAYVLGHDPYPRGGKPCQLIIRALIFVAAKVIFEM